MNNSFYALVLRMKHIDRWGLMRNTFSDNLAEHSLDTAILAHALCLIGNEYFGKSLDAERCAVLALFHDAGEIITGDMPTPIKYRSEALRGLYREVEEAAEQELAGRLPERLQPHYQKIFAMEDSDAELKLYVKAADKLSAYIKCLQETQSGNREFSHALTCQEKALREMELPEVGFFFENCIPAFSQNLDEQQELPRF